MQQKEDGITPACAGQIICRLFKGELLEDHPRLRGTNRVVTIMICFLTGSPPLARDKWSDESLDVLDGGITPACAGQILSCFDRKSCPWDHPRLRGTNDYKEIDPQNGLGSPPLARDKFVLFLAFPLSLRITPACAGQIQLMMYLIYNDRDHPRLRGTNLEC